MPVASKDDLLKALNEFISFGREIGSPKSVQPLEPFIHEFEVTKPTRKTLEDNLNPVLCSSQTALQDRVLDTRRDPKPGMKKYEARLHANYNALFDLIFPPRHANVPQTEIVGLAGNKESTSVIGDSSSAKVIAKAGLDVVQRFSKAVFKQDIETAYSLCANELRVAMSVKQFINKLAWADSHFGGKAVDLKIETITWIYADDAARKRSITDGEWPKETPKANKRALVGAFWIADKKRKLGRSVFFWVTEEAEGYRIAKFKQYLQ